MPRSTKLPIRQREDRRHAALLRAKVEVGIVLRDMMSAADASDYFQREGVPAEVSRRLLQRDDAGNRPDNRPAPQPGSQQTAQQASQQAVQQTPQQSQQQAAQAALKQEPEVLKKE